MLSVVVPVLNGGRTLKWQLGALQAQQLDSPLEIVVADNGSTDGTQDLVQQLAAVDSRLRLVDAAARRGVSVARNVGLAASRYPFAAICDADDLVTPGWAQAMVTALRQVPLVAGPLEYDLLNPAWAADARGRTLEHGFFSVEGGPTWPYPFGCNTGVHRQAWENVGGYDEDLVGGGEDNDFAWRLRRDLGIEPRWEPAAVVHYRCRQDLRSIFLQSKGYGAGAVRLSIKWADVWTIPPRPWGAAETAARYPWMALARVRDRGTLAAQVARAGWQAGVAHASRSLACRPGTGTGTGPALSTGRPGGQAPDPTR